MNRKLLPHVSLILLLILAYGGNYVLEAAKTRASETFIRTPVIWLNTVFLMVFAAVVVGFIGFTLIKQPLPKAAPWMYLVIGCLIVFLNPINFTFGIFPLPIWFQQLTPDSFLIRAGAFTALLGIISLIRRTHQQPR